MELGRLEEHYGMQYKEDGLAVLEKDTSERDKSAMLTARKAAFDSVAMALASIVLPTNESKSVFFFFFTVLMFFLSTHTSARRAIQQDRARCRQSHS